MKLGFELYHCWTYEGRGCPTIDRFYALGKCLQWTRFSTFLIHNARSGCLIPAIPIDPLMIQLVA